MDSSKSVTQSEVASKKQINDDYMEHPHRDIIKNINYALESPPMVMSHQPTPYQSSAEKTQSVEK